jgi:predicted transcriptional regulator
MRGDAPHELGMSVDRIVSEIFPDETGGARLQQVGLFIVIFVLEGDRAPVTAPRLAELTGESVSQVQKQLQKLVKVGVIERKKVRQGRGHALRFAIKHTKETKRLLEAMSKAAGRMR